MESAKYTQFLARNSKGYDTSDYYTKLKDPDSPVFDLLDVRWIVIAPGVQLDRPIVYDNFDGRIFENTHVMRTPHTTSIRYDVARETTIVTSITRYPGWRTNVGRIVTVNDAFIGIVVPPGHGVIELRYVPMTFWCGVIASLLTLLSLAAAVLRTRRPLPDHSPP